MRTFQGIGDRDGFEPLVIRTDYRDNQAWEVVRSALEESFGDFKNLSAWIVDDPSWSGVDVNEALEAFHANDSLVEESAPVFFLADQLTMQSGHHALVAVSTVTQDDFEDEEEYEEAMAYGRTLRATPQGVHMIHVNLETVNMDFEEFAAMANEDDEGIYRHED
ncbi:DUF6924 domain-containing protein [Actinacidiphila glaucinigra]|uniref:DUF6924 domain-containing protein n=1 Tax=Actinacidiphila glaucinigra TaxID=235986 RepID=UPI0035D5A67D